MRDKGGGNAALFVPRDNCPVKPEELGNSRKTIVRYIDKPKEEHIEEARRSLNHKQHKRQLPGNIWKGEAWFEVKPGALERYNEQAKAAQARASAQQATTGAAAEQKQHEASEHKEQRAEQQLATTPSTESKPVQRLVEKTTDYSARSIPASRHEHTWTSYTTAQ